MGLMIGKGGLSFSIKICSYAFKEDFINISNF